MQLDVLSEPPDISTGTDGEGVRTITMQRRDGKANALTAEMVGHLRRKFDEAARDLAVQVVVLRAGTLALSGNTFCGGADLTEVARMLDGPSEEGAWAECAGHWLAAAEMLDAIDRCGKPVIACVTGKAVGLGATLAAVADHVIADRDRASVCYPEVKLALAPKLSLVYLQRRMMAHDGDSWPGYLRHSIEGGEAASAETALEWGLFDQLSDGGSMEASVEAAVGDALACRRAGGTGKRAFRLQGAAQAQSQVRQCEGSPFESDIRRVADYWCGRQDERGLDRSFLEQCARGLADLCLRNRSEFVQRWRRRHVRAPELTLELQPLTCDGQQDRGGIGGSER